MNQPDNWNKPIDDHVWNYVHTCSIMYKGSNYPLKTFNLVKHVFYLWSFCFLTFTCTNSLSCNAFLVERLVLILSCLTFGI